MTDDFVSSRRRIIGWYADPRWTAYCGVCGVRLGTCGCGSTPAGATLEEMAQEALAEARAGLTRPMEEVLGTTPPVSLPNNVEASAAPVEETQAVETEPPPSGWRDRPALL